jgi:hypothetical protein
MLASCASFARYDDDGSTDKDNRDAAAAVFKCWLLVTGICCSMLAFFQSVNYLAAHGLYQVTTLSHANGENDPRAPRSCQSGSFLTASSWRLLWCQLLRTQPGLHGRSQWHLLSFVDKCCYCWSVLAAIVHVFVDGTHAIFSRHITPKEWFLVFWKLVGTVDNR